MSTEVEAQPAHPPVPTRTPTPTGRERRSILTRGLLTEAHDASDEEARQAALSEVVMLNMGVARSVAGRHRSKGIPLEDLEQVAYMALVRAAQRFDADRQKDFLSYAVPTMRGEIRKYFRDLGWTVRPPRRIQEVQSRVVQARDSSTTAGNGVPDVEEIADRIGESPEDVAEALTADGCFHPASLDAPVGYDSGVAVSDTLPDEEDRSLEVAEARVMLRPVLRRLPPRDRRIVQLRFFEGCTQREVADDIGVTQMQVSRLLSRIMRDLRGWLDEPADRTSPA
jgi:RNA polymerase sigma-B factor